MRLCITYFFVCFVFEYDLDSGMNSVQVQDDFEDNHLFLCTLGVRTLSKKKFECREDDIAMRNREDDIDLYFIIVGETRCI